ncbi:c-type cytochrome [Defluviimonas sp. SAOS-178_SWC]|uniref:c-type cytochrome n=1 Tax=Defluviimonas sp. SAOS-178_SWC TaxID=3121287 RepID=UPI003222211E
MRNVLSLIAAAVLTCGPVLAEDLSDPEEILTARHGYMLMMAMNLAPLGGMAKGEVPYDAETAGRAASSLAALASVDSSMLWVPGTENGVLDDSSALPEINANAGDRDVKFAALKTAADAMVLAAGTDLASLQGAMKGVGAACGGCHKQYRKSE